MGEESEGFFDLLNTVWEEIWRDFFRHKNVGTSSETGHHLQAGKNLPVFMKQREPAFSPNLDVNCGQHISSTT
jgi:hypothetical protein